MFVSLVDRIISFEPLREIRAIKNLSFREDYLRDHFPGYAIMPGALQLEAMIQSAQWLLRKSFDFPQADFHVSSVANTRYSKYVRPGDQVHVIVTLTKHEGAVFRFRGVTEVDGTRAASAQFEIVRYDAAWRESVSSDSASDLLRQQREAFGRLARGPVPAYGAGAPAAEQTGGAR